MMKRIIATNAKEMAEICAELARQGITFESTKVAMNEWRIEIVGW
jgi:hypothetical protein